MTHRSAKTQSWLVLKHISDTTADLQNKARGNISICSWGLSTLLLFALVATAVFAFGAFALLWFASQQILAD